jgi:CHAT domain-containing protein/tetratricopeptide (TPR) repeat protein
MSRSLSQLALMLLLATQIAPFLMLILNFPNTSAQAQTNPIYQAKNNQLSQQYIDHHSLASQKVASNITVITVSTEELRARESERFRLLQQELDSLQLDLEKSRKIERLDIEAETLNRISAIYFELNQIEKSLDSFRRTLVLYKQLKNQEGELNTIGNIANVYFKSRRPQDAEQLIQNKIRDIRETSNSSVEQIFISILNDRLKQNWGFSAGYGIVKDQKLSQDYRGGELSWQEVLSFSRFNLFISRLVESNEQEIESLHGIGWAYRNLGEFPDALDYYNQAVALAKLKAKRFHHIFLLVEIGIVYTDIGQYDKALKQFQLALAESSQAGDGNISAPPLSPSLILDKGASRILRGFALTKIGMVYLNLDRHEKAFKYLKEAKETGVQLDINTLYLGLGAVYSRRENYSEALKSYQRALELIVTGDASARGDILNRIGLVYVQQSDYSRALDSFQEAFSIFKKLNNSAGEAVSLSNIGLVLEKQGKPEVAIIFYKESVNTSESIRDRLRRLTIEEQKAYVESVAGTYRSLADLLLVQGRVLEAQQVLELLKIQELRDFSRDTRAGGETQGSPLTAREAPIPPAFSDKIALGQKLTICESQKPRCAERESLQAQLKAASNTFNQLADRLRTQQAAKDPAQLQRDELTLAAQKVVLAQPKTVLIYPLVLEDKLWLVWGTQAGVKGVVFDSKEIPVSRKELSTTVVRFRQLLERPGDVKEFQQVSQKLYGWLIAPIRSQLDANGIQNLVFSLDRATRYIPMSALYDGQHYLVEKFALSTILTSGTTDTSEKLAANPTSTKVLGMGLSNAVSGLNPLPSVVDELNGIIRSQPADRTGIFPGSKFLNQTFDRRAFKDLIDYRILHIATHGKFVSGQPEDSFLVLGNGDPLRIPEIKSMTDLNAIHLVVLSACETAKGGEDKEGLEVSGLSYYFITSGAKAVIASLWLVNDASTSLLMQRFYQNLAGGTMTKAEALRQVQRDFINGKLTAKDAPNRSDIAVQVTNPRGQIGSQTFAHPYYWAPFILIGNSL